MDLDQAHACIADELNDVESVIRAQLTAICGEDDLMNDVMEAFFSGGGKRLRPRLVLLSAMGLHGHPLDGPVRERVLRLAAIVELVHSASLMHDDVLDRAATRRNAASLNERFGDKIAILAGDVLYSHAFELLLDVADPHTTRNLVHCVQQMCHGEMLNLTCRGLDAYETVIEDKTALLMAFACEAGAHAACGGEGSQESEAAYRRFGHSFGMVYQLADDLDDDDVSPEAATREQIRVRRCHFSAQASAGLQAMPPSPYRDGLTALLDAVAGADEDKHTTRHTHRPLAVATV